MYGICICCTLGLLAFACRLQIAQNSDPDWSELCWQVVEAYEGDKLTLVDEDAKHLEKVQKSAEQKDLKVNEKEYLLREIVGVVTNGNDSYQLQGETISLPHSG